MREYHHHSAWILLGALLLIRCQVVAEEIRVAAASNVFVPMKLIAARFEANTSHKVLLSFGSTGKHYAQIRNGAPFDLFFAADQHRPKLLESEGIAVPATRFIYAVGHLLLWSPEEEVVDSEGRVLVDGGFGRLAMANPRHAPYGRAAREVLTSLGIWDGLQKQIVRGENVAQAYQFVATGNADVGLIAYSQIWRPDTPIAGSWWRIPESMYTPIRQEAVLLNDKPAARDFLSFATQVEAQRILLDFGYEIPSEHDADGK